MRLRNQQIRKRRRMKLELWGKIKRQFAIPRRKERKDSLAARRAKP